MLILEMILKITGFTQEELANYLNVSRQTVNMWLNGNNISERSIELISEKFMIPKTFFYTTLNEDLNYYKLIYSTIQNNWSRISLTTEKKESIKQEKIRNILNQVEGDMNETIEKRELTSEEILTALQNGYNPYTGEVYNQYHILNDKNVNALLNKLELPKNTFEETFEKLTEDEKKRYERILDWRDNKALEENIHPSYYLLNRNEMLSLSKIKIYEKEDLKNANGIGEKRYLRYGDELFYLLKENNNVYF